MIRALIFDCFGVIVIDSSAGEYRDEALLAYIAELHAIYKLGLLSNISQAGLDSRLSQAEQQAWFDVAVASGSVGLAKPDTAIYQLLADRLGVRPDEAVMIDDVEMHCAGARAAGMQAICYKNLLQLQQELDRLTQS